MTATVTSPREVLDALAARVAPAPVALSVPDLGIEMAVLPQALDERGQMALPASAFDAGWYQYSAGPGASQGTTVLASHVFTVAEGEGPFLTLLNAQPGQLVSIVDAEGEQHEYRITTVEQIPKDDVPLDRIFTTVGDPRLVMVTCGGDYDADYASGVGRYQDNVIVTAERLS
ncbi:sortase (surface protein transpeptidase) [Yonghaparkia alkaliphila]|uniref:Sortase (Surface protein transpeptidase) n=2 Tax=Microcella alkalica TaxID=355930 RepID=A0A839EE41_9MICO|nr:sortase (surface protein transpeptidase) [Microcella alkalica]